jgi:hypothetical protein
MTRVFDTKFSRDFLNPMPLEDIINKVNSIKKGSLGHEIMIIDGKPLELSGGSTIYVTETFKVRFNINYYNMKHSKIKSAIEAADSPESLAKARKMFDEYKRKELVAKTAIEMLEYKEKTLKAGLLIAASAPTKGKKRKTDPRCPSIVYCDNGTVELITYPSFQNTIRRTKTGFEYSQIDTKIRFFVKEASGEIFEFNPYADDKVAKVSASMRETARKLADKKGKGGLNTPARGFKIKNILHIW